MNETSAFPFEISKLKTRVMILFVISDIMRINGSNYDGLFFVIHHEHANLTYTHSTYKLNLDHNSTLSQKKYQRYFYSETLKIH